MQNLPCPQVSAIVAMSENRVIGHNNNLPWYLPADLHHFKTITTGHPILMGRKTYQSIGKPLPNRTNIILSRNPRFQAPSCIVVPSMTKAIEYALTQYYKNIFIIGGADVYNQCMSYISRIYLTTVHEEFEGDVFFPELNLNEWKKAESITHVPDSKNVYAYTFSILDRI
jgi:dihydrofolate reductase